MRSNVEHATVLFDSHLERRGQNREDTFTALLSGRQKVILLCLAHDWTDKRIARRLCVSDRQVRRDIASLCRTFGATGRIQLVAMAFHKRLLSVQILANQRPCLVVGKLPACCSRRGRT
ncbi:MAG TPA: LuxR C-terminal-related transcriptional regulator [Candidatus Stackebrandtia faecavium]|nr:LuxR C-terminal-related transcriptional regulator [Candidatus Stackebrandtia faecavium]